MYKFLFALLMAPSILFANEDQVQNLSVELNSHTNVETACQLNFLARNQREKNIEALVFEAVLFDKAGQVMQLALLDFEDIPRQKRRVRQFVFSQIPCDNLGQILINGVQECKIDGKESQDCITGLNLTSKANIKVIQ